MNNSTEFSLLGVKLGFVYDFYRTHIHNQFKQATTNEVCERIIKPTTASTKVSYCEYLLETAPSTVGTASVFISHAWQCQFGDVVEAMVEYFKFQENGLDIIIWFDLFSTNQHLLANRSFDWWCNTFKNAISKFGQTVMVFAPWNDPMPLRRGWCIWELYCTIETCCQFDIAMSQANERQFIEDIDKGTVDAINKMIATVDCERSECRHEIDRQQIHEAIQKTIGFTSLNKQIFETMREWVIATYLKEQEFRKAVMANSLAGLYESQGKFELAEPLYLDCLEKRKVLLGPHHPDTLTSMINLAALYYGRRKYELAESLNVECYEKSKASLGANHPVTLKAMNRLGLLYFRLGKLELAEPLCIECSEKTTELLGPHHADSFKSREALGRLYEKQGKFDLAEKIYTINFEKRCEMFGINHPDSLKSMKNLAELYESQGKYELAEQFYRECLNKRTTLLGPNHPDTLHSMNNIARFLSKRGKYELAEALFIDCIEKRKVFLGPNHEDTLKSTHSLRLLYEKQGKYELAESLVVSNLLKD